MVGICVVLSLIISLVQPFQYGAGTQILIIQKQEINSDAYTATKSAERIGKNLANIIYTSSFYNEVITSNSVINDKFPQDVIERRKAWKKNVDVSVLPETGILKINVYDIDRDYASQLVRAIAYVLVSKGAEYHGGGTNVEIKVVDDVSISKYPVRPNVAVNVIVAFILGFILGSIYIVLAEAKKYEAKQFDAFLEPQEDNQEIGTFEADNWQPIAVNSDEDFDSGSEKDETPIELGRQTQIITMYDHLKNY